MEERGKGERREREEREREREEGERREGEGRGRQERERGGGGAGLMELFYRSLQLKEDQREVAISGELEMCSVRVSPLILPLPLSF